MSLPTYLALLVAVLLVAGWFLDHERMRLRLETRWTMYRVVADELSRLTDNGYLTIPIPSGVSTQEVQEAIDGLYQYNGWRGKKPKEECDKR